MLTSKSNTLNGAVIIPSWHQHASTVTATMLADWCEISAQVQPRVILTAVTNFITAPRLSSQVAQFCRSSLQNHCGGFSATFERFWAKTRLINKSEYLLSAARPFSCILQIRRVWDRELISVSLNHKSLIWNINTVISLIFLCIIHRVEVVAASQEEMFCCFSCWSPYLRSNLGDGNVVLE